MLNLDNKCIIILSEKSSGSSALMKYLLRYEKIHAVKHTRHNERETLFWTKAASILGLPQKKLIGSEVPIPKGKAYNQLVSLIKKNTGEFEYKGYLGLIMDGWSRLCKEFGPVFLEKSPHYLANWSNLELIHNIMVSYQALESIKKDYQIVGLVRHPLNTIASAHRRWKWNCYEFEKQWYRSYTNLLKLKKILGDKCHIVKYEDMCKSAKYLRPVLKFAGYEQIKEAGFRNPRKLPKAFKFKLQGKTIQLARKFGY
jgi:hypothetical protein